MNPAPKISTTFDVPQVMPLMHPAFVRLMAVQMAFGLSFSIFLILPKHLALTLRARPSEIGWIMAMYGVANIAAARPINWLMVRVGRKRVLQLGALCAALGGLVFVFASNAGWLAGFGRFLQGVAWAMVFTAGTSMAVDLAPPGRMAQSMGLFASAVLAMNAIGPPLAEPLLNSWGYGPVFMVAVAGALVALVLARRLPETLIPPAPLRDHGKSAMPPRHVALWVVLGLVCGTMFTFYQPLALEVHVPRVSDFLLGYTASALAVRLLGGRVMDKVGYRKVCLASLALYALVVLAMRWMSPDTVVVLGVVYGLAHGTFYPAMLSLSVSAVTPAARGALMSTINVAFHAGAMAVVVLGYVAEFTGLAGIFTGAAAVAVLGLWWLRSSGT